MRLVRYGDMHGSGSLLRSAGAAPVHYARHALTPLVHVACRQSSDAQYSVFGTWHTVPSPCQVDLHHHLPGPTRRQRLGHVSNTMPPHHAATLPTTPKSAPCSQPSQPLTMPSDLTTKGAVPGKTWPCMTTLIFSTSTSIPVCAALLSIPLTAFKVTCKIQQTFSSLCPLSPSSHSFPCALRSTKIPTCCPFSVLSLSRHYTYARLHPVRNA
jgi:hypothetical protein